MKRNYQVVIAGAGVVGLTLAALLRRSVLQDRLSITIVDANPRVGFSRDQGIGLRVSAISAGSVEVLRRAGCWSAISGPRICPYSDMQVWDSSGSVEGPETLRFAASEFAVPQLGYIVENQLIQHTLLGVLDELRQTVDFDTVINAVDRREDCYVVRLSDGRELLPDLLIAADGGGSFVRKQTGIIVKGWSYQQSAFVTHLKPARRHRHTAWQRFLSDGPIALLPLADGRVSVVWSTTPEQASSALSMADDELSEILTNASDHVLGKLEVAGERGAFPLRAQYAKEYVRQGLALVGDAAHSVHPLAGQGANLGIADASCLAAVLGDALAGSEAICDYRVLRRYERARKGANKTMLQFIDGISTLFGSRSEPVKAIRAAGMRAFNRSGPVRSHAVKVALGLNGH